MTHGKDIDHRDRIIIIGGGRLGRNLMKDLPNAILIESSPTKVQWLVEKFGEDRVIHGGGSEREFLREAGIERADVVIVTPRNRNITYKIVNTLMGFKLKKIMVRVTDEASMEMYKELGLEPFRITPAMSAKLVERIISPEAFHIHEFIIPARCKALGLTVEELDLPEGVTLVSVLREEHLEVPEPTLELREGDVITVIASDKDVLELREILGARLDLNPLQNILVPYGGKKTVRYALKEAFILAKYAKAEVILLYDRTKEGEGKIVKELEQMFKLQNVDISIRGVDGPVNEGIEWCIEECDLDVSDKIDRRCVLFNCVMVDPEETTFFQRLTGNTEIRRLVKGLDVPVMVAGNMNPYRSMLLLIDSSEHSDIQASMAIDLAILFGSRVHMLVKEEEEGEEQVERLVRYTKRAGRLYGLDITEQWIEGNPTLEFVENVKSGDFDLVVVNWNCRTIKRDIVRKTVDYGPRSVLIIN